MNMHGLSSKGTMAVAWVLSDTKKRADHAFMEGPASTQYVVRVSATQDRAHSDGLCVGCDCEINGGEQPLDAP